MAVKEKSQKSASRIARMHKPIRKKAEIHPKENISALGKKLLAIRKRIEASGIRLLTLDEIRREHAEQQRESY